jgi:chromosome segregation ATPase
MVRKQRSLKDLLNEEVQKSPSTQESAQTSPDSETEAVEPDETFDEITEESSPPTKRTNITKAELETEATQLRAQLQAAYQKNSSLQQQIADLQLDLQDQKTLVEKLQAELKRTEKLKTELEQAKQTILQLSESNTKPPQQVNTPSKENKNLKPQKLVLDKSPLPSVQPTSSSGALFDTDVGWFD